MKKLLIKKNRFLALTYLFFFLIYFLIHNFKLIDSYEQDLGSYVEFNRNIAYPYLLLFSKIISGDYELLIIFQIFFFLLSIYFLTISLKYRFTKLNLFLINLFFLFNPFLIYYLYKLIPESLIVSLFNFFLVYFLKINSQSFSKNDFIILLFISGLIYLLKPIFLSIFLFLFFVFYLRKKKIQSFFILTGMIVFIIFNFGVKNLFVDKPNQSILLQHIFAKACLISNFDKPKTHLKLTDSQKKILKMIKKDIEEEDNIYKRKYLKSNYEMYLQSYFFSYIKNKNKIENHEIIKSSLFEISRNKMAYFNMSLEGFFYNWIHFSEHFFSYKINIDKLNENYNYKIFYKSPYNYYLANLLFCFSFVLTIFSVISVFFPIILKKKLSKDYIFTLQLSLYLIFYFFIISLLAIPTSRYTMSIWGIYVINLISIFSVIRKHSASANLIKK